MLIGACGLAADFFGRSASSCKITFPCLEHSTHTVSLAPSIMARTGSVCILRPQTSHLNVNFHLSLSLLPCYVYTCRNTNNLTMMKYYGKCSRQDKKYC